ncbi:MAG TPA: class I SAM-dependent methyltransferase [Caldimonas sp.]|nr:class I SAM-dependent methyltransferase [Caldimonas sp.]
MNEIDPVLFREFERAAHDRVASAYQSFFARITANAAMPLLDAVQAGAGTRVLDVATGPGVVAAHAARRGARVTGIDLSPRMVALAARICPSCTFLEADVGSLPFEAASFDAVVCAFGIGHFPDAAVAMRECGRVLAPGGRLAVAWWDRPERNRLQGAMLEAIEEVGARPPPDLPAGPPLFRYSDDAALAELLRDAGLDDATVVTHAFVHRMPSTEGLWDGALGSLARVSALIHPQPAEVVEKIRHAFERRARVHADKDGLALPMSFKVAAGRRPKRS